ncbi:phage holin family protein [Enterococcus sp.]|uniref:phage holin family protein n=1 Tax=Enterococcus sp. TaxID=35783 RepID=UPI0025BD0FEE|nr:phage holin family protein [Enterococcus sp.]
MEKHFNSISTVVALIGGTIVGFLGGMDGILHALIFLMIADYLSGITKSIKLKQLNSEIGFIGLLKKGMILLVVAVAVELERMTNQVVPLREIVIMFYVANEGISLLENVAEFLPLPDKLKEYFSQMRMDHKNDYGNGQEFTEHKDDGASE